MLIRDSYEELFDDEDVVILERSTSRTKMEGIVCSIYTYLGVPSNAKQILSSVAQSTFTKSGAYNIFLIASRRRRKIYLMVDACEIRGNSDIYYELPHLTYKPRLFGLLGYRVDKE